MKLFIIGNGFDIGHGIPCRYSDFYQYLSENRRDILDVMDKFYYTDIDSELWSDFENCLEEYITYDSLSEIIDQNLPDFASDDFRGGDYHNAQIYIEQECDELLENLRLGFEEWIKSLDITRVNIKYKLDITGNFITFNYTDVLERIYKIPTSNVLHIHNKIGQRLIFGHGKATADFNVKKALYGSDDEVGSASLNVAGHEQFAENAVRDFYDKMRKPTDKIMQKRSQFFNNLSNVDKAIVLGHSYNEIDVPYFEKIAESIHKKSKWTLCYFTDKDKQSAENVMKKLKITKKLQEYKHCDELQIDVLQ